MTVAALLFSTYQLTIAAFAPLSSLISRSLHVGFLLLLVFVLYPAMRRGTQLTRVPLLDWVLALTGFGLGFYQWVFESESRCACRRPDPARPGCRHHHRGAGDDAYRLHSLRHSTAHILAQAVLSLYPQARLAIGPSIEDGFYYDIDVNEPISEETLAKLEVEMKRIVKENQDFVREEWDVATANTYFGAHNQTFKLELIESFNSPTVGIYKNTAKDGKEFVDLCKGPHVMRTGQAKHFKLLKVSGAYWRGDPAKPQLQRIYGTVFATKDALDQHLFRLEEAKKRDHRKLGRELDLFMFHDWSPGAVFWLPKGEDIYNTLASRMRALLCGEGYVAVRTPLIFDKKLWETSGHWQHYIGNMFHFSEFHHDASKPHADTNEETEQRHLALKAMNCPSHMPHLRGARSAAIASCRCGWPTQGVLHRNERSGALPASPACATSPRTTPTSSAPKSRSAPRSGGCSISSTASIRRSR